MTRDEQAIEQFVERELARASEVEPVAGLEDRLIARLRVAEPSVRRRGAPAWWWVGGSMLAAAACILFAVFVSRQPRPSTSPAASQSASVSTPSRRARETPTPRDHAQAPAGESAPQASPPHATARARRPVPPPFARAPRPGAPRLAVFPAPRPLSRQERLLLALASQPEQALAFIETQQRAAEPLQVPEIVVEPIGEDLKSESRIQKLIAGS